MYPLTYKVKLFQKILCFVFITAGLCFAIKAQQINGMSLSGPETPYLTIDMFEELKTTNADWVAFIPEMTLHRSSLAFLPEEETNLWGKTTEATIQGIQLAKQAGLKVFLKPHIVLGKQQAISRRQSNAKFMNTTPTSSKDKTRGAAWRGELSLKKEKDWQTLETNYEAYILKLAKVAAILEVDLFSVGTELKQFALQRPTFWKQLIYKVRQVYAGPLTYAANWDEYQKISFWKNLDYIGVDTYFPISKMKTPTIKKTLKNWKSIQRQLSKISKKNDRKILLTEFGYRNISYAGKHPWTHNKGESLPTNNQAQVNLYEAFFQTFWKKSWIAGGFSWKWFAYPPYGNGTDTSFSVQGKPALKVLQKWYSIK